MLRGRLEDQPDKRLELVWFQFEHLKIDDQLTRLIPGTDKVLAMVVQAPSGSFEIVVVFCWRGWL